MEKVKLIKKINGDWQINPKLTKASYCPDGMEFRKWAIGLRDGDNTIKVYTW